MLCLNKLFPALGSKLRERESKRLRRFVKIFSLVFLFFLLNLRLTRPVFASTTVSTNITTDGQLGVGTSSPVGRLDVRGLNATNSVASISGSTNFAALVLDNTIGDLFTASSSGQSKFVINNSGSVGIGINSPTAMLHMAGANTNYGFITIGSSNAGTSFPAVDITRSITTALGDNAHGYVDDSWIQFPSNGYAYASFDNHLNVYGTANYDHLNSFQSRPIYNSLGTISHLRGFHSFPTVYSGTATELNHVEIDDVTKAGGSGVVTTQNGILFKSLATGSTNHYINFNDAAYIDMIPTSNLRLYVPGGSQVQFNTAAGATSNMIMQVGGVNSWGIYANYINTNDFALYSYQATTPETKFYITKNGNVGIGTTNPNQKLEVNGGARLNTTTTKPTCDSTQRGTFWVTQGAAGVKDNVEVCAKDAADAYAWRTLY